MPESHLFLKESAKHKIDGSSQNSHLEKLMEYSNISKSLDKILEFTSTLFKEEKLFVNIEIEQFVNKCENEGLDEEKANSIISDWRGETDNIFSKIYQLLNLYFQNNIDAETLFSLLEEIQIYKKSIDDFFENQKIEIVNKLYSNPTKDLLEKVETDIEILKFWNNFEEKTVEILGKSLKNEQTATLSFLSENSRLSEVIAFAINSEISENIKNEFKKFDEKIMQTLISDLHDYASDLKSKNNKIYALLGRMQRDLEKLK
jgi:hypothetical protein